MKTFTYILITVCLLFVASTYFEAPVRKNTPKDIAGLAQEIKNEELVLEDLSEDYEKNSSSKKGIAAEVISVDEREILRIENNKARSDFGKTYKKAFQVNFKKNKDKKITFKFDKKLKGVASVVLVTSDGSISPSFFSLNARKNRVFKDGEDMFKGDWVKLDGPLGGLDNIVIIAKGQEVDGVLDVYIQKVKEIEK